MAVPRRTPATQIADVLGSPVLNALVGLAGVVLPIAGSLTASTTTKNVALLVESIIVIALVANHFWQRSRYIRLPRVTNLASMDDAQYYDLVRAQLEQELISDYGEIADGHLRVYASEVPRLSVLLVKTLTQSQAEPARILASDLTTDPSLLAQRREYLSANRRFIDSGGTIQRMFICYRDDLVRTEYARNLLQLIDAHREIGVTCGIAVRDQLRADQAMDVVVFAAAAALVEEEQGDADYTRGRSSVYFKGVERWVGRFEAVWGHGADSSPRLLQTYETAVRPMLDPAGSWDGDRAKQTVDGL